MTIREKVFSNLNAAKENQCFEPGGELDGLSAADIANDLVYYASDCETDDPNTLIPHVEEWLKNEQKNRQAELHRQTDEVERH